MVSSSTRKAQYTLTSATQAVAVPFYFIANSHVRIVRTRDGTDTVLTGGFTLSGAGTEAGGTCTFDGTLTAIGDRITIRRAVPLTQLFDYAANDRFPATTHERALDQLTMMIQEQREITDRCLVVGETEVAPNVALPLATRKNKILGFDANGAPQLQDPLGAAQLVGDVIEVSSYAAARAIPITGLVTARHVRIAGYGSADDGAGGLFTVTTVDPGADNNGTILKLSGGNVWLLRSYSGAINPKWFGAKGDGVTDDITAMEAAVALAKPIGARILIPEGTYRLTNHFPVRNEDVPPAALVDYNGMTVEGMGKGTIIKTDLPGGCDVLQLNGVKNATFMNLVVTSVIDGSVSGSNGVSITNGGENLFFFNIHAYRMPYVLVGGVDCDGGAAFSIQHASNALNDRNIRFIGCSAEGDLATKCGSYGFNVILTGADRLTNPPQGILFSECVIRDHYRGVMIQATGTGAPAAAIPIMSVTVSGNKFYDVQQNVIIGPATGVNYINNTHVSTYGAGDPGWTTGGGTAALKYGGYILSAHNLNFVGNQFYFADSDFYCTLGGGAIGENSTPSERINFSDNHFRGTTSAAYGLMATVTEAYGYTEDSNLIGNTFEGFAAANAYAPVFYRTGLNNTVISADRSLMPKISQAMFIAGPELILNGTAWTGAVSSTPPNSWSVAIAGVYSIFDSGDGAPYDACLKIAINATPTANASISQTIPTVVGRRYKLSFAFKKGSAVAGEVYIGSTSGAFDIYASGNITDAAWATRTVVFTATSTTTSITLLNRGSGAGETALFDTVSVTEIPAAVEGDLFVAGNVRAVLPVYADNAAAVAGSLQVGQFYRTGADPDPVCIVHA